MHFGVFDLRVSKMRGCDVTFEILFLVSVMFVVGYWNGFEEVIFVRVVFAH